MFKKRKPGSISAKDAALEIHLLRHQHIEPFSLTIRQREIFGFVGPIGSGKSTIIDLLSGRKTPINGAISILGYDSQRGARQARKLVGVVSPKRTPVLRAKRREFQNDNKQIAVEKRGRRVTCLHSIEAVSGDGGQLPFSDSSILSMIFRLTRSRGERHILEHEGNDQRTSCKHQNRYKALLQRA